MSAVKDWVREMTGQEPVSLSHLPKKQVACRVEPDSYVLLQVVASDLGMSPTGCAEGLLKEAIWEAYQELRGEDPRDDEDYKRLMNLLVNDHLKAHGFKEPKEVADTPEGVIEAVKQGKVRGVVMSEEDKQAFLEAAKEPVRKAGK